MKKEVASLATTFLSSKYHSDRAPVEAKAVRTGAHARGVGLLKAILPSAVGALSSYQHLQPVPARRKTAAAIAVVVLTTMFAFVFRDPFPETKIVGADSPSLQVVAGDSPPRPQEVSSMYTE